MSHLKEMPPAGLAVIIVILLLFAASVVMLCIVSQKYRRLSRLIDSSDMKEDEFLKAVVREFAAVYKTSGDQTNTPGIIENVMASHLSGLLFCERFLNNSVSLFVTLGLFGTFLGLSLAVVSLTNLISYSNTSEWLSVLDSVGGGLISALSGMGVAFYTSIAGAGCSIILTVLRTIFSPQNQRAALANQLELWLDHKAAPSLPTDAVKDEVELAGKMITAMDAAAKSMDHTLSEATESMKKTLEESKPYLVAFHQTVEKFNSGVHDFSEVDYNLRGTVERLDLSIRDLVSALRRGGRGEDK